MFNWFFEMPEWLYLMIGFIGVIAFVSFITRKEIAAWYVACQDPSYQTQMLDVHSFLPF